MSNQPVRSLDRPAAPPAPLAGRRALVTGASSGIGAATARVLAVHGAAVALGARRADRLEALVADIRADGGTAVAIELDVTEEASCRRAVHAAARELGGLDVVVNNAGVMLLGPVVDADTTDWRRMLDTNVLGLMHITHAALPHLLRSAAGGDGLEAPADRSVPGRADVINMSSVAGRTATAGAGVYSATKWAVNAFSESLRQEVTTRGVRVALVEPGLVATELTDHITDPGTRSAVQDVYAGVRTLDPQDVAHAVLHVLTQPAHVAVNEVLVRPTGQV